MLLGIEFQHRGRCVWCLCLARLVTLLPSYFAGDALIRECCARQRLSSNQLLIVSGCWLRLVGCWLGELEEEGPQYNAT